MNDVKKTWCAPAWLLDPERLERQLDRLSAEGWQLEGTGWFSLRYRRGKPNEYCYRVQYLYESRDGQKDDYVRGLAELGVGFLRQAYRSAKRLRRLRQARLIEE